jgi:hypothetical protein
MFTAAEERLAEGEEGERFPREAEGSRGGDGAVGGGDVGSDPARPFETVGEADAARATGRRLPLVVAVLLADAAVGLVVLAVLVVIGLQRLDGSTFDDRHTAYVEDVAVFFVVGAVFAVVAFLLRRSGQARAALVQLLVALAVLGLGGFAAATGSPGPTDSLYSVVPDESPSSPPASDAPSSDPAGSAGSPSSP